MAAKAIRITAVPRSGHPNSGLQAMYFASHYGDTVWALPSPGSYIGDYSDVRFFFLDCGVCKRVIPMRAIRLAYMLWLLCGVAFMRRRVFFVHSFMFAIPLWLLGRRYCIFVHGTDRRFLDRRWAKMVVRSAVEVFGVGFGIESPDVKVREVPNIFTPATSAERQTIEHDVLFVLRNAQVKNPLYPLTLAERLGGELGLSIVVLGVELIEMSPDDQSRLRYLQRRGVKIDYRGRQPYEEVVRLMATSRVLMIPSSSEGIPKVLLEGLSQGMRIVVNQALSLPQPILERVDCIAIDDWSALAASIRCDSTAEQRGASIRFAHKYLEGSQASLMDIYDDIYTSYRAGPGARRRAG